MANAGYVFTFQRLRFPVPFSAAAVVDLAPPIPLALALGSIAAYGLLFFFYFPSLAPRAPRAPAAAAAVERAATLHHAALFLYSFLCFAATLAHVAARGELADAAAFFCAPLPPALRALSLTFTLSKLVEWGDTAVLFARGKGWREVGFLHSYHHATTFCLFLLVVNFPSTEKLGMLLNGFVHTLMYYHFAFRLPACMRPVITAAQIVQLVFVTWAWWVTPRVCPAHAAFPSEQPLEFAAPFLMVPVYTLFFLEFFARSYVCPARKAAKTARD